MTSSEPTSSRVGEAALKVFHLKPDDVVLIGNLGESEDGTLVDFMDKLRAALPTARGLYVFAGDIDVDVARAHSVGFHRGDDDEPGFVYNAIGEGVRQDLVERVMAGWAQMSPDGDPATPLRSVGDGYINHVDSLARIAALAVVKALAEQP